MRRSVPQSVLPEVCPPCDSGSFQMEPLFGMLRLPDVEEKPEGIAVLQSSVLCCLSKETAF